MPEAGLTAMKQILGKKAQNSNKYNPMQIISSVLIASNSRVKWTSSGTMLARTLIRRNFATRLCSMVLRGNNVFFYFPAF